jgi:hypothetical protein
MEQNKMFQILKYYLILIERRNILNITFLQENCVSLILFENSRSQTIKIRQPSYEDFFGGSTIIRVNSHYYIGFGEI